MTSWDLGWEKYDDWRDIDPNNGKATFIVAYEEWDSDFEGVFNKLKDNLSSLGFSIAVAQQENNHADLILRARSASENLLLQRHCRGFAARFLDSTIEFDLWEKITAGLEYDFCGELVHGVSKKHLQNADDLQVTMIQGPRKIKENGADDLMPETFYLLKQKNLIVGKALLTYYNYDMDECAPTIKMFEIIRKFRLKGIGSLFLERIEQDALDNGFFKIWASEMKSAGFWKSNGYVFDLDEGEKILE